MSIGLDLGSQAERKLGETVPEWKERLFKNRKEYGLTWDDVVEILENDYSADHQRKVAYGYTEAMDDVRNVEFDRNVLIMNDVHLPYERKDTLEIIKKHAPEIDTIVFGGDIMDCESVSSFPKIDRISLLEELDYTHKFLKKVRQIAPHAKIVLIKGNHEARHEITIKRMQKKQLQKLINPEILEMFVDGFTLYEDGKKIKYEPIEGLIYVPSYYVNLDGKLIVAHPRNFSQSKGTILEKAVQHFGNYGEQFDVVVFGHTHKMCNGIVERHGSKYAIENGCLCQEMPYATKSGSLNYTPQSYGYCVVRYDKDEPINPNNIDIVYLPSGSDMREECRISL